jgi:anti-sigma factor RsiW
MTQFRSMSEDRDCGGDSAAYALGALEPAEAEAFRQHLHTCIVCRDELAAYQQVVDVLPMTAPVYPPSRALRRRVLRAVQEEARRPEPAAGRRSRRPTLRWASVPRPAVALVVLLAFVVAGFGGAALSSNGTPKTRVISASVGDAQLRVTGGHAELIVHRLPLPASGRIYEVWIQHAQRAPSPTSALFSVTRTGAGVVGVPGDLHGVSHVLVTQEPAGGSQVPTSMPVIVAQLS